MSVSGKLESAQKAASIPFPISVMPIPAPTGTISHLKEVMWRSDAPYWISPIDPDTISKTKPLPKATGRGDDSGFAAIKKLDKHALQRI